MPRLASARGIKSRWTYTVAEVAARVGVSRNTVRQWIKDGLPLATERKPFLIHGADVIAFLGLRRASRKRPMAPGEIYCLPCHAPKRPAGNMADFIRRGPSGGMLTGLCPDCGRVIRRAVSRAQLHCLAAELDLAFPRAIETLRRDDGALANNDFEPRQR